MAARKRTRKPSGLPHVRPCGDRSQKPPKTLVQSVVFDKRKHKRSRPKWTAKNAKAWAKAHGFVHSKVDEKENTYRFRQFKPGACEYRTKTVPGYGIQFVIETPKSTAPPHVLREMMAQMVEKKAEKARRR